MTFGPFWERSTLVVHELDADPVTTRYYPLIYEGYPQSHLTSSGEYVIETEKVGRNSCLLVLTKLLKADLFKEESHVTSHSQDDQRVYLKNIVCYPSRFADSDGFLLLGRTMMKKCVC